MMALLIMILLLEMVRIRERDKGGEEEEEEEEIVLDPNRLVKVVLRGFHEAIHDCDVEISFLVKVSLV